MTWKPVGSIAMARASRRRGSSNLPDFRRIHVLGTCRGEILMIFVTHILSEAAVRESGVPWTILRPFVDGKLNESKVLPTVEEVIGRQPHTFEQWAIAHADAFR